MLPPNPSIPASAIVDPSLSDSIPTIPDPLAAHVPRRTTGATVLHPQCPLCLQTFSTPCALRRHMPRHTGNFKFWCKECSKGFPHRQGYQAHLDKHEGITFPCQKCDKRFQTKISLKYHQSEHTGIYVHYCQFCNQGFNRKIQLLTHEEQCR